ncbi:hypothetical protein JCGZ_03768 [Jatropha curcas]|uniref:Uncharacterized protein n=1 Tax=Jatropha curcas TaxID=180498 RepID=A0A067KZL0_JATCU|nr:hypothetical protein JCGZ_03768 [Jatropha curcas]
MGGDSKCFIKTNLSAPFSNPHQQSRQNSAPHPPKPCVHVNQVIGRFAMKPGPRSASGVLGTLPSASSSCFTCYPIRSSKSRPGLIAGPNSGVFATLALNGATPLSNVYK